MASIRSRRKAWPGEGAKVKCEGCGLGGLFGGEWGLRLCLAKRLGDSADEAFVCRPGPPGGRDGLERVVGLGVCPIGVAMETRAVAGAMSEALEGA